MELQRYQIESKNHPNGPPKAPEGRPRECNEAPKVPRMDRVGAPQTNKESKHFTKEPNNIMYYCKPLQLFPKPPQNNLKLCTYLWNGVFMYFLTPVLVWEATRKSPPRHQESNHDLRSPIQSKGTVAGRQEAIG